MVFTSSCLFPEMLAGGATPAIFGFRDKDRYWEPTPAYGYGWIIRYDELYEAIFGTKVPSLFGKPNLADIAQGQLEIEWEEKGWVETSSYNPDIPRATDVGEDVHIYMACNDSPEIMKKIMEDKVHHDRCRESVNRPKAMELPPAWFRGSLDKIPKDLKEMLERLGPSEDQASDV